MELLKWIGASGLAFLLLFCSQESRVVDLELKVSESYLYNMDFETLMSYESISENADELTMKIRMEEMKLYDVDLALLIDDQTTISL